VRIQLVDLDVLEPVVDFIAPVMPGFASLIEVLGFDLADHLTDLEDQAVINFLQRRPSAHHQIPDRHGQLAGHGGHDQIDLAFAGQQLFAPLRQRCLGAAQDGLAACSSGVIARLALNTSLGHCRRG